MRFCFFLGTVHSFIISAISSKEKKYLLIMSEKLSSQSHLAEEYLRLSSIVQGTFMDALLSKVPLKSGHTCLDVGCGTGNLTAEIAKKLGDSSLVIGCDPDSQRISTARRNHSIPRIKFYEGTVCEAELEENFFDIALSNVVYHWMNKVQQQKTTEKVFSLLKSHGIFGLQICQDLPFNVAKLIPYVSTDLQKWLQDNLFFFTEHYYRKHFTNAGFEIVSFDLTVCDLPIQSLDDYLQLMDATYSTKEFSIAYLTNKEKINFCHFSDGTLSAKCYNFCIILRKP